MYKKRKIFDLTLKNQNKNQKKFLFYMINEKKKKY